MTTVRVAAAELPQSATVVNALTRCTPRLVSSRSEARRLIASGGVTLGDRRPADASERTGEPGRRVLSDSELPPGRSSHCCMGRPFSAPRPSQNYTLGP